MIVRIYFSTQNLGERFYLRLLLTVVKGPTSFKSLCTVDGVLYETFKAACVARGLLEDDEEWIQYLREAAIMKTGRQLRRLFCIILTECAPLHPLELWEQFSMHICDDLGHNIRTNFGILNPTDNQIKDYGLYLIDQLLNESGKSLTDFPPMPHHVGNWNTVVGNKLLLEHLRLQHEAEHSHILSNDIRSLNDAQKAAYNAVISSVIENKGITFFLSGGAGTGKIFVYNTIATKLRSL